MVGLGSRAADRYAEAVFSEEGRCCMTGHTMDEVVNEEGEGNWSSTFAWSEAGGPRQGSAQKFDLGVSGPEAQLP
jgi:hypothetical protein